MDKGERGGTKKITKEAREETVERRFQENVDEPKIAFRYECFPPADPHTDDCRITMTFANKGSLLVSECPIKIQDMISVVRGKSFLLVSAPKLDCAQWSLVYWRRVSFLEKYQLFSLIILAAKTISVVKGSLSLITTGTVPLTMKVVQ
jgi:hypothetical protein